MSTKPRHEAYSAIEDTMLAAVRAAVNTRADKLLAGVKKAISQDDFREAHKLVNEFTLKPAIDKSRAKFSQLGVSAILFGASRHKPVADTKPVKDKNVPGVVQQAVNQLCNMLQYNATLRIRAAALLLIAEAEEKATKEVPLHKYDPDQPRDESGKWVSEDGIGHGTVAAGSTFYHGTGEITSLKEKGFDAARAGKGLGSAYGKGVYLTSDLNYATGYVTGAAGGVAEVTVNVPLHKFTQKEYDTLKASKEVEDVADKLMEEHFNKLGLKGAMAAPRDFQADALEKVLADKGVKGILITDPTYGVAGADTVVVFDTKSVSIKKTEKITDKDPVKEFKVKKSVQSIAKADDLSIDEIGEALSAAIMGNARMVSDIGANLVTSRLASYGFLAEAKNDGVVEFQISAVNDDATCEVCQSLDGTVFEVDKAFARVEAALGMDDPNELKIAAPWPDQSADGLKQIEDASSAELQAMGYDAPPYHPSCRCILIPVDHPGAEGNDYYDPDGEVATEFEDFTHDTPATMSLEDFMRLTHAQKLTAIANGTAPLDWEDMFT